MDSVNTLTFFGFKEGDSLTIEGIGYDKRGHLIQWGRYINGPRAGKSTSAKIVKLADYKVKNETAEVIPCALL
jgi:hypothetical protein